MTYVSRESSIELRIGKPAPDFQLVCVDRENVAPRPVTLSDYLGRWLILMFYPHDFSFVCPTELTAFSARVADFQRRQCDLLAVSVDSIELHQEWLSTKESDGGVGPLQFPLASDPEGDTSAAYGVWVAEKGVSTRGLFIIDPEGLLQYAVVHNLSVGRSTDEVLRVLDALRDGGLCPASWTTADGTIDPELALQSGRILGHYRIRDLLGNGTFGTVFSAWDLLLERMVALKILKRNVLESRDALLAEARVAARLNHPNVCTVFGIDEEDGLPVIVMEHLSGRSLSEYIGHGVDQATAERLTIQIAAGLAAAHAEKVVHGDLKPANVMVTDHDETKVLDFGLARSQRAAFQAESASVPKQTQLDKNRVELSLAETVDHVVLRSGQVITKSATSGAIRGTPAYMSPEQAAGSPTTTATDVFALGLLLYEMLTGKRALGDDSVAKVFERLAHDRLSQELAEEVDPRYRQLLTAMLAVSPDDRPTMSEVVGRLAGSISK